MNMKKKAILNYRMVIALLISLILLLYEMLGNEHLFVLINSEIKPDQVSIIMTVYALSVYLLVAGMFPALPYSFSIADEKRSGLLRLEMIRYGYKKYINKKMFVIGVSGMMTTVVPYLFILFFANMFGRETTKSNCQIRLDDFSWGTLMQYQHGGIMIVLCKGFLLALFGLLWAEMALLISLIVKNQYISFVLPYIVYELLYVINIKESIFLCINPRYMIRYDVDSKYSLFLPFIFFSLYIVIVILLNNLVFRRMIKHGQF